MVLLVSDVVELHDVVRIFDTAIQTRRILDRSI